MNKLIITKEASKSIENAAIYPFKNTSISIDDSHCIIFVDDDVLEFIKSHGIDIDNIEQVSNFIMSYTVGKH